MNLPARAPSQSPDDWPPAVKAIVAIAVGLVALLVDLLPVGIPLSAPGADETVVLHFYNGLALVLLVSLAWDWRYGLLSAVVGMGCMGDWFHHQGAGPAVVTGLNVAWVAWHGWNAARRRERPTLGNNPYVAEIPFRVVAVVAVFALLPLARRLGEADASASTWILAAHASKDVVNAYVALLVANALLLLAPLRRALRMPVGANPFASDLAIGVALLFGVAFWILDAVLDRAIFYAGSGSLLDLLALNVPPHEVYARLLFFFAALVAGIVAAAHIRRIRAGEDVLREREENLAITLRSIGDAVIATDDEGRVANMNPVAEELTGWPLAEAVGRPSAEVFHIVNEITDAVVESPVERVLREGVVVGLANHTALIARNGARRPIADSGAPIRDADGRVRGVVLVFRDVTEEYAARRAVERSEERLRVVVRHAPNAIAVLDRDLRYVFVSERFVSDYRLGDADIVGRRHDEVFENISQRWKAVYRRCLEGAVERADEDVFERADGAVDVISWECRPWRDGDGEIQGIVLYTEVITARKQAEEALRRAYAHSRELEKVIQRGPAVAFAWRPDEGWPVKYVSDNIAALGYEPEDFYSGGLNYERLIHPDDFDQVAEATRRNLEVGRDDFVRQYRVVTRDGQFRWLEDHVWASRDGRGEVEKLEGVALDITEKKTVQDQLVQVEKMHAIGQIAGGVAHDFNNQLTGILGCADTLLEGVDDPELRQCAQSIVQAANRSAELTAQLLRFARKQDIVAVPVDIHRVIDEVVALLERSIDKRIQIARVLEAQPSATLGDPNQIENALLNIAINARDAMPEGGEMTFETRVVELDDARRRQSPFEIAPGRHIRIAISDTGVGMSERTRAHIFEPFYTTKERGRGSGIGLTTVYSAVRDHGGAIEVESEPGRGTTFAVFLPAREAPAPAAPADAEPRRPAPPRRTIMIVDDESIVRQTAGAMLERIGYDVVACPDGIEAIETYRKRGEDIDAVLLDLVMPELSGRDTFVALREIDPHVRVLLCSGYSVNEHAQAILDEGAAGFIQKPFRVAALAREFERILDEDPKSSDS